MQDQYFWKLAPWKHSETGTARSVLVSFILTFAMLSLDQVVELLLKEKKGNNLAIYKELTNGK